MTQPFEGVPEVVASANVEASAVHLTLDDTIYPLEAVYGASFTFIDRCFVHIDRPVEGSFRVVLATKKPGADAEALRNLVGEFANELLACAWRHDITKQNRATIESVTMQALAGAMGPPSLDDLEDFDFGEEPFEDPLGIAMSWEDKYGKDKDARKKGEEPAAAEPAAAAEPPADEAPVADGEGA